MDRFDEQRYGIIRCEPLLPMMKFNALQRRAASISIETSGIRVIKPQGWHWICDELDDPTGYGDITDDMNTSIDG